MPVAGALIGAAGSAVGGGMQANAAGAASNAQQQAGRESLGLQAAIYNQSRQDTLPYQATGTGALNMLAQMYGLPSMAFNPGGGIQITETPGKKKKRNWFDKITDPANLAGEFGGTSYDPMGFFGKPMQDGGSLSFSTGGAGAGGTASAPVNPGTGVADFSAFYQTPDYLVARDEGIQGLDRGAAARGRLYSGGADADRMRFSSNLGSQAFGNFQNNLFRLAGFGGTANQQLNSLGQNFGSQAGNALTNVGNARASGYLGQGQAQSNAWSGIGSAIGDYWGSRGNAQTQTPTNPSQQGGWFW
jgi:hypothetical protein